MGSVDREGRQDSKACGGDEYKHNYSADGELEWERDASEGWLTGRSRLGLLESRAS